MNANDLRILLEQTNDKFSIFASHDILSQYELNEAELLNLIRDFLNDEEKMRLFDYPHFMQLNGWLKSVIIALVSDDNILLQILNNDNLMNIFAKYQIVDIIKKMNDSSKKQLLHNQEFIEKHQIDDYLLKGIIASLSDEARTEILQDKDLITNRLHLEVFQIAELVKGLPSEEDKITMMKEYKLESYLKVDIIKSLNSNRRIDILLKEDDLSSRYHMIEILRSLNIETLGNFLEQHRAFCSKHNIHPYQIICALDNEKQKDFVTKLDDISLTLNEKREILAMLNPDVKQSIDTTNFPEEYKSALSIQTDQYYGIVNIDFERKLEDYRGLDNLMKINAEEFTQEQRIKFMKLCDICPDLRVNSTSFEGFYSTASEYKEAEEWITSIISKLNPEYSKAQKMAVIDNEIGKKISYSPDFDTEVFDDEDSRALWKIISSGYGVCNGIANVEQYILNRVGIESEMVGSGTHSFLKIKDIELPLANGEIIQGNTILDPTWNLTSHRFGARPDNFCISYEQARMHDIDSEGKDHQCHKNDEKLQDATLSLDDRSLRELFKSVGLADKDGQFPIKKFIELSQAVDEFFADQPEENIQRQFLLLKKTCPEFATCQNSSMKILSNIVLSNENLKFNKCIVNRVYDRTDKEKKPILYVYIDSNELGQKFYFANIDGEFLELSQEEFVKRFECYDEDLKRDKRT